VSQGSAAFTLSAGDRARFEEIERLSTGGAAAVDPLIARLTEPSWAVRRAVIAGLVHLGDLALEPLCRVLEGQRGDEARLAAAVEAISASPGDVEGVLLHRLERRADLAPALICDLAQILGRRKSAGAVPVLAELAGHADDNVAIAAIEALGRIGGAAAVEPLLAALSSGNFFRVFPAIDVLGRSGDPRAVQALRALLEDPLYASNAAEALEGAHEAKAPAPAPAPLEPRRALSDPDPAVRALAASSLGAAGDPGVVPALFELLGDPDPGVTQAASGAIQSLGSARTEALALAAARSPDARVRRAALRIVAYFGYPSALGLLIEASRDDDPRIRDVAIQGLAFLDEPRAVEALLGAAAHPAAPARASAMRALGHLGNDDPAVLACLLLGIADPDAWVRYYACQAVGKVGGEMPVDAIVALLDDEAGQVRVAAVEALARLGTDRAVVALHHAAGAADPDLSGAALLGLGSLRRLDALPLIERALASPDRATRLVALAAAAALRSPEVRELLRRAATTDVDDDVRRAALEQLAALEEALASDPDAEVQRLADVAPGRRPTT
jgi:HEAT repeat protein